MKKIVILLLLNSILSFSQTTKSKNIDFNQISSFYDLNDSTTYTLNKRDLFELIKKSQKKFTLVLSYGFWCKPCNKYLPQLLNFINKNKETIELVLINVEPDNSKRLYLNNYFLEKRFNYVKPTFMISEEYGTAKWKKYDGFLIDLIGQEKYIKTMSGMSQHVLYKDNKIVYLSNYNLSDEKVLEDLNNLIKQ